MVIKGGVSRNPDVVWRGESKGGRSKGVLLFNYSTRGVHFLEGPSKKIWESCHGQSLDEIINISGIKGAGSEIENFIEDLEKRDLIRIDKRPKDQVDTNLIASASKGMWSKRVYFDAPLFVQFDCTNRCNLSCIHCVTKGGESRLNELSTPEARNLIKNLGAMGVFQIGFSGGEPLTRKDIFILMDDVKKQGMKLQLTTNATLVDENLARKLVKLNPITVGVSLEGGTRESYERFRGKGNFERFLKGVKTLKEFDLPVKFKSAILRKNLDEIDNIIDLALDLDVEAVDMFLFYPQGRGKTLKDEKLTPLEIRDFLTKLSKKRREMEGKITIDVDDKPNAFLVDPSLSHSTCGAGVYWAEILPQGEVVPCVFFKDAVAGNIKKDEFKAAWESSVWEPFRNRTRLKGKCKECEHVNLCGGGCRANGYESTGDFLAEDTLCWYEKKPIKTA